jgi:small subunit ribosomal protein S8
MSAIQDPVSDMIVRIRNGGAASLKEVSMSSSKVKNAVAAVMKEEGFISDFEVTGEGVRKTLVIKLKYQKRKPVIEGLKRVSKPSCRIYCGADEIPKVMDGFGSVILSTPIGIISDRAARKSNVGGEVMCYIW